MKKNIPLLLFIFSVAFLCFFYGFFVGYKQWTPYWRLHTTYRELEDFAKHWKNDLNIEPTRLLVTSRGNPQQTTSFMPGHASPGYRIISGLTAGRSALYGVRLYDQDWHELNYWPIAYDQLDPKGHDPENAFPHGLEVLEDGSIVVNFDEGNVLARISACGKIMWKRAGAFHHAISRSHDGTLWTLRADSVVQIDPDTGEDLRQFDMKKDVFEKYGLHGVIGARNKENEHAFVYQDAFFHMNDVEALPPEFAKGHPLFEAGDLLVSLRNLNLVTVIDGKNGKPKWWSQGPWHRQHDPDFRPDGSITVYDNAMGLGQSRIIQIFPASGEHKVIYQGTEQQPFYSWRRGKHQHLDNGAMLITEAEYGRAFEVDSQGQLVWEYNNIFDAERNGVISKAMILPENFFLPGAFACEGPAGKQ